MADSKKTDDIALPLAKEVAQSPVVTKSPTPQKGDDKKPTPNKKPVMAVHRINGTIEPQTPFRPETKEDLDHLESLGSVRDLTEAEKSLFDKLNRDDDAEDALG